MSHTGETFFTSVGCIDGRIQAVIAKYGQQKFNAKYPDTITEAGLVGLLTNKADDTGSLLRESIKKKILISVEKHHSKGIVVHGHQECAVLDAVDDKTHREDIRKSIEVIRQLSGNKVPVIGVFVKRSVDNPKDLIIEEL